MLMEEFISRASLVKKVSECCKKQQQQQQAALFSCQSGAQVAALLSEHVLHLESCPHWCYHLISDLHEELKVIIKKKINE